MTLPSGRPPFRADHVGSLLRPPVLRQAFKQHLNGAIDDAKFAEIQNDCIRDVLKLQESAGLEVVNDGEFRRGFYWSRFVERTEGFAIKGAVYTFRDDTGHEYEFTAPYASQKIRRVRPLAVDEFEFVKAHTKLTPKITLPAPSTMHFYRCSDFADAKVYPDAKAFFLDLGKVFQEEIADLAKAGCEYVQLDEVAIALLCDPMIRDKVKSVGQDPDELVDLYIDAINEAVSVLPPNVRIGIHMCRGNLKGHYLAAGGYEDIAERFFSRAKINHFLLEFDRARRRFLAVAICAEGGRSGAWACYLEDAATGESGRSQTPRRRGEPVYQPRPPRNQPAVRVCLDDGGKSGNRAGRECKAKALCRCGEVNLELRQTFAVLGTSRPALDRGLCADFFRGPLQANEVALFRLLLADCA